MESSVVDIDLSKVVIPDLCVALEAGLRALEDKWDKTVLHVTDLAASLPIEDGICPRYLYGRLHGWESRPLHRGELWMFDNAKEMHLRLTSLVGWALEAANSPDGISPEVEQLVGPALATLKGWRMTLVEHSLRKNAGEDLGLAPDPYDVDDGTLDVELWHESLPYVIVVDWKTLRGSAFSYLDADMVAYPKHQLQVRTYMRKRARQLAESGRIVVGGLIFYADREGQNFARQPAPVTRDDEAVEKAARLTRAIVEASYAPPILSARITVRENKGDDALYLKGPWQCDRCPLLGLSCPGALPDEVREFGNRVIANRKKNGELVFKKDVPAAAIPIVEELLWKGTVELLKESVEQ